MPRFILKLAFGCICFSLGVGGSLAALAQEAQKAPAAAAGKSDKAKKAPAKAAKESDGAEASTAPKAAAKASSKGAGKVPGQITVTNNAKLLLAGVEISTKEKDPRVVGNIAQGLQPGKSTKLKLKNPKGCDYSVVAVFEDGSEGALGSVDLCKDPLLRFTGGN